MELLRHVLSAWGWSRNSALTCYLACFVFLGGGCVESGVATPEPSTLQIAGSTEMRLVLNELTASYSRRNPNVLFSLRGGGSTLAEEWVDDGRIDLAASTLVYSDEELPGNLVRVPIGLDGVAVIVHETNTVRDLTLLQLRGLYSGQSLDWQDVGGDAGEVLLVSREDGSGTRRLFEDRVMGEERVALTAVVMPTSEDVVEYVASHPLAIGYVSRAYVMRTPANQAATTNPAADADDSPAALSEVDPDHESIAAVRIEGRLPDGESLASQLYHLSRPLYLVRRRQDQGLPQAFIDFVLSPPGQQIVERYHVRIR